MLKGKTESGFAFEIDDEVLDDWELLELLEQIDDGDVTVTSKAIKFLLGKEQLDKLKEHLRKRDGKVKITAMIEEFNAIMNANKETKN